MAYDYSGNSVAISYWCESFQYYYIKPEAKEQID